MQLWKSGFALLVLFFGSQMSGDQGTGLSGQAPSLEQPRSGAGPQIALQVDPVREAINARFASEQKKGFQAKGLIYKGSVTPHWFADNTRFWYKNDLRGGNKE